MRPDHRNGFQLSQRPWVVSGLTAILLAVGVSAWANEKFNACFDRRLAQLIERISPSTAERAFVVLNPRKILRLNRAEKTIFSPELVGVNVHKNTLSLRLVTLDQFREHQIQLMQRGFWILTTPSGDEARVKSAHLLIGTDGAVFNRYPDESGVDAMRSFTWVEAMKLPMISQMVENEFVLAQFFETSAETEQQVEHFFHDRVWNFHARHPDYFTQYVPLPFSRDTQVTLGENCLTFSFPEFIQRWTDLRPELKLLEQEMGSMRVSEIPSRQIFLNPLSQAYRGTLLITAHPDRMRSILTSEASKDDPAVSQLLFDGPLKSIQP